VLITQDLQALLGHSFACACGRRHEVPIQQIVIRADALQAMTEFVRALGVRSLVVVDDDKTGPVLGDQVLTLIRKELPWDTRVEHVRFVSEGHLAADQDAIARAQTAVHASAARLVVAVGSGTITDIARYASYLEGCPFISLPTAPSVDGYASTVAALQFDGVKVTKEAQAPLAIFALPAVLAAAPWPLIQAGYGDLLGKTTSLLDWKIAALLYGQYWCDTAYRLVSEPLQRCVAQADALRVRDPAVVAELFSGLLASGVAMAMVGNSQPASGCEHHCSHYWDYLAYKGLRPYASHGLQVGYATRWTIQLYQALTFLTDIARPKLPQLDDAWEQGVRKRWGTGAQDIFREQRNKVAWLAEHDDPRLWQKVTKASLVAALQPEYAAFDRTLSALQTIGITDDVGMIGVTPALLRETLLHAHEVRARYTLFDFWSGQDRLSDVVEQICPVDV